MCLAQCVLGLGFLAMTSPTYNASAAFAVRMYPALDSLRNVTRDSPSADAWQAFARVGLDLAGYRSDGDTLLEDVIEALDHAIALRNPDRELEAWAMAWIDKGDALVQLMVYPSDREALLHEAKECYEIAIRALDRDAEPQLSELWGWATASFAQCLRGGERLNGLRHAVASLSEDRFQVQRLSLVTEFRVSLIKSNVSPDEIRAAFEAEIALFDAWKDSGYWQQWLDAQRAYGHWLVNVKDRSAAIRVLSTALATWGDGNEELKLTLDGLTRALKEAKEAYTLSN